MKGFEKSKGINRFVDYLSETKQLSLFENTIKLLRSKFPSCDFFLANRINQCDTKILCVSRRNIEAEQANNIIFMFRPRTGALSINTSLSLDINVGTPGDNRILRQEIMKIDGLKKLKATIATNRYYSITLDESNTELDKILDYFLKSEWIVNKMEGEGNFPDDYQLALDERGSDDSGNSNKEEVSGDGLGLEERIMKGGKIYANKNEKKLTQNFVRWIKTKSEYSLESLEQRANARDRIDVVLSKKKETIYAELKSVSSYSGMSKRAIRAALGQILDYQFYDGKPKASQLWIVLDSCEITDSEMVFINTLNKKLNNLNLKLIVEDENSAFKILNS